MGLNQFIPPRCEVCGKFIGWTKFVTDQVHIDFTPDTEYTTEETLYTHKKCIDNGT